MTRFLSLGLAALLNVGAVIFANSVSANQLELVDCSSRPPSLAARDMVDQLSLITDGISSLRNIPKNLWLEDIHQVLGLSEENSPWKYSSLADNIYYNELTTCDSHNIAVHFERLSKVIIDEIPNSDAKELRSLQNAIAKLQITLFRLPYECTDFQIVALASINMEVSITSALNQHGVKSLSFPRVPSSSLYCQKDLEQDTSGMWL
jgi:hypothetical protein